MVNSFMIYINMFTHEVTWRIDEDIQNVKIEHLTAENREMILITLETKIYDGKMVKYMNKMLIKRNEWPLRCL